jgi:hypothetical protein
LPLKKKMKTWEWMTRTKWTLNIYSGLNRKRLRLACNGAKPLDLIFHRLDAPNIRFREENRQQLNSMRSGSVNASTMSKEMKPATLASLRTGGWLEDPCDLMLAEAAGRI